MAVEVILELFLHLNKLSAGRELSAFYPPSSESLTVRVSKNSRLIYNKCFYLSMHFISGTDRSQTHLFPLSLEEAIATDNEVRVVDLFVTSVDVKAFGFTIKQITEGRLAYHPSDLLKLFIYGYLNRIRSSRALEKECKRNIELMWLLKSLAPDHNTISNFRKENGQAIKEVFRSTVKLAKHLISLAPS